MLDCCLLEGGRLIYTPFVNLGAVVTPKVDFLREEDWRCTMAAGVPCWGALWNALLQHAARQSGGVNTGGLVMVGGVRGD
jgi:hypothetical protein